MTTVSLIRIVEQDAVTDAQTLPCVEMPSRDEFVVDPRPDVANVPCRADCP
jgi:cytochrome c